MAGGFNANTRQKWQRLPTMTRPSGGGPTSFQLPKTGMLARMWLYITGSVSGSLSNQNPLGFSSVVQRVKLLANNGIAIVDISGPGYSWLMRDYLESEYIDIGGLTNGRTAITATTFNISMLLPVQINMRDPLGLIMLQNEETIVTLEIDWLADASVATGATVTATCVPYMEFFTVPADPKDYPPLNLVHSWIEDYESYSATGQQLYYWPRGNTYLKMMHGYGFGVAGTGADNFDSVSWRVNQSDYIYQNLAPGAFDLQMYGYRGRARPAGVFCLDLMASSGLGSYGLSREYFNSALVTDIETLVNCTAAGTLYALREQLVPLAS
jgi:hypothetical protein